MRRRDFIAGVGSAAAASPLSARAQQDGRVRRIGVLQSGAESDPSFQDDVAGLRQRLQQLGWIEGRNLRLDLRFSDGDLGLIGRYAQELVDFAPDVLIVGGVASTRALQERTRTIPIVFVSVGDPVASGIVRSIARPEGHATGITNLFPSIAGKWLEFLKEASPLMTRVALVFPVGFTVTETYLASIETAAKALSLNGVKTPVRNTTEIQRAIEAFAAEPNGALILVPPPLVSASRELILRLAAQHRLPVCLYDGRDVARGGLMSYGPNFTDLYRSAASYVDRILRGAKISELPVQFPTRFELVINLKAAKAIGLEIPETLTARADEVIQ